MNLEIEQFRELPLDKLMEVADSNLSAASKLESKLAKHWLDALLVASLLGFVVALVVLLPAVHGDSGNHVVVATSQGLQPFRPIVAADLKLVRAPREPGSIENFQRVVGRYAFASLGPGAVIHSADLSEGAMLDITQRTVITIDVKSSLMPSTNVLPMKMRLVISPRSEKLEALVLDDVVLLACANSEKERTATVAVRNTDVKELAHVIGSSEVWLGQIIE